jgi:hypothetical protein
MVIGALAAGLLVGVLVPSPREPAATGSGISPARAIAEKSETADRSEAKAKRDSSTQPAKEAPPTADTSLAKRDSSACALQTWPYYSPSCLDRGAAAGGPVRVLSAKPADPTIALRAEETQKQPAPRRQQPARQQARESSPAETQTSREESQPLDAVEQERRRHQPRGQSRITRVQPPDDNEWIEPGSPRVLLRRDGTRVYIVPDSRHARPLNQGYWRSW